MKSHATKYLLVVVLGLVALVLGGYAGWQKSRPGANIPTSATLAQIELPDIDKNLHNGKEWLGKVVVVNHWASWCPPCREEIPMLIETQQRLGARGVQVIGIAHDLLDTARAYSNSIGIIYPSLVAITGGGELMRQQGNTAGGLPFTAFFDRNGKLADIQLGLLSEATINQIIARLL